MAGEVKRFERQSTSVLDMGLPELERIDTTPQPVSGKVKEIEVEFISPSPYQARTNFPETHIRALADSIADRGLINPITVRPKGDGYELISGECRWRAVQLLGHTTIKCTVHNVDDLTASFMGFDENFRRKNFTEFEAFQWVSGTMSQFQMSQTSIARKLQVSEARVSSLLSIGKLPKEVTDRIRPLRFVGEYHIRALRRLQRLKPSLMYDFLAEMETQPLTNQEALARCDELTIESKVVRTPLDDLVEDSGKVASKVLRKRAKTTKEEKRQTLAGALKIQEIMGSLINALKADLNLLNEEEKDINQKS